MVDYKLSGRTVTVTSGGKALGFALDRIPQDWETLFRDPETAECVNKVVQAHGAAPGGSVPTLGWDEVRACTGKMSGADISG